MKSAALADRIKRAIADHALLDDSAFVTGRDVNFDGGDMLESAARARDIFNQHQELAIET